MWLWVIVIKIITLYIGGTDYQSIYQIYFQWYYSFVLLNKMVGFCRLHKRKGIFGRRNVTNGYIKHMVYFERLVWKIVGDGLAMIFYNRLVLCGGDL